MTFGPKFGPPFGTVDELGDVFGELDTMPEESGIVELREYECTECKAMFRCSGVPFYHNAWARDRDGNAAGIRECGPVRSLSDEESLAAWWEELCGGSKRKMAVLRAGYRELENAASLSERVPRVVVAEPESGFRWREWDDGADWEVG